MVVECQSTLSDKDFMQYQQVPKAEHSPISADEAQKYLLGYVGMYAYFQ